MRKLLPFLIIFAFIMVLPQSTFAENATSSGKFSNVKQKVQEQIKNKVSTNTKEQVLARIRKSIEARWNNHQKAITRAEVLLTKLQTRIDSAKSAGKDVTEMTNLMTDAKTKLADAKTKLGNISSKKGTAVDKAGYFAIAQDFLAINQDLRIISHDAAKIISSLKGYNRSPEATSSAK